MLDAWVQTEPRKLSPEAPVIVADYKGTTYSPGGAGNAAVNCAHLGAETYAVGLVGKGMGNEYGTAELRRALQDAEVNTNYVVGCCEWPTIEKRRFVDSLGRHLLRVDREQVCEQLDMRDILALNRQLCVLALECTSLLVSDYGKGTCDPKVVRPAIRGWAEKGHFVVVNGKPERFVNYAGATVLVLNREEAVEFVRTQDPTAPDGTRWDRISTAKVVQLGRAICASHIQHFVVTAGADGLYWAGPGSSPAKVTHIPGIPVSVADVAGAGDTICATLAYYGEINGPVLEQAVENAAKVVAQHGTSVPKQ